MDKKRKRSTSPSSSRKTPAGSSTYQNASRRGNRKDQGYHREIEVVTLEDDLADTFPEVSASKKKRISTAVPNGGSNLVSGSGSNILKNNPAKPPRPESTAGASVQKTSMKVVGNAGHGEFKVPQPPPRPNPTQVMQPPASNSSVGPSSSHHHGQQQTWNLEEKQEEPESPSDKHKQAKTTKEARKLRSAIIEVLEESLNDKCTDSEMQDIGKDNLEDLIKNLTNCTKIAANIFATKRFPFCQDVDDLSSETEIEDFARWWLFGISGMLLRLTNEAVLRAREDILALFRTLSQFLHNGHPNVIDKLAPQLLKILRDLSTPFDEDSPLVLDLQLTKTDLITKASTKVCFHIKLSERNAFTSVPLFVQCLSMLFPRIYYYNPGLRQVLLDLLQRFLFRTNPREVSTVLRTVCNCVVPAAGYLTEASFMTIIIKLLGSSTIPTVDNNQLRQIFGVFHNCLSSIFLEVSGQGQSLLFEEIMEFVYSDRFMNLCKNQNNESIVRTAKHFWTRVHETRCISPADRVKFSRLLFSCGLDVILHPVLDEVVSAELSHGIRNPAGLQSNQQLVNAGNLPRKSARDVSEIWDLLIQRWESALKSVKALTTGNEVNQFDTPAHRIQLSTFVKNTAALIKFSRSLRHDMKTKEIPLGSYGLMERTPIQDWSDLVARFFSCSSALTKFSDSELYAIYCYMLETIESLDQCNWFEHKFSFKVFQNLIALVGWAWVDSHSHLFPEKVFTQPAFCSNSRMVQLIKVSPTITSKVIRTLRRDIFRPWNDFIEAMYINTMQNVSLTEPKNIPLIVEILDAMSDISWPFKEIPIESTLSFIASVVKSNLWKEETSVRSSVASALVALPCIWCGVLNSESEEESNLPESSGCEKCLSTKFVPSKSLPIEYAEKILMLSSPVLKSKFLFAKLQLSDLIERCHIHSQHTSATVAVAMMEVAFNGKILVCEEIFRKIGKTLVATQASKPEGECQYQQEAAQKIFGDAVFSRLLKKKKEHQIPGTHTKILKGILNLAGTGLMSLSVCTEIVKCMIVFLIDVAPNESVLTICSEIISKFSELHKCAPRDLLSRIRNELCPRIVSVATKAYYGSSITSSEDERVGKCTDFVSRLKFIGNFRRLEIFIGYMYPTLMEHLVPKLHNEPSYQFFLTVLSKHAKETELRLLQDHVTKYLPTLLLDYGLETIRRCIEFLRQSYNFDVMFGARQEEQRMANEAMCRLDDRKKKVISFLSQLCKEEPTSNVLSQLTNKTIEAQDLLNNKFFGFFIHLDTKVQSKVEPVEEKKKILLAFASLIKLMSTTKIAESRFKVYKTLNTVLHEGVPLYKELFQCWVAFSAVLDSETFKTMICDILAALLPFRESPSLRAPVDNLISRFVCFRKRETEGVHQQLYFLLDQCDAEDVKVAVGDAVTALKTSSWFDYFHMLIEAAGHENLHIRYQAFRKLIDVFKYDRDLVYKTVLAKGQKYVSQVISTILTCIRCGGNSDDEKLRLLAMNCFGLLGALDPDRFRVGDCNTNTRTSSTLATSFDLNYFGALYIQDLCREFNEAKDTTCFDYCGCLIQIALRELQVKQDSNNFIWKFLPQDAKNMTTPLFDSKYWVEPVNNFPIVQYPIYLSENGKTFEAWLFNLLNFLIDCLTVEHQKVYNLFVKSKSLYWLGKNTRIATFIIPFVAMYAIFCAEEEKRKRIIAEITTVLERWTVLDAMKQKLQNTIIPEKDSDMEFDREEEQIDVENETVFHSRCTHVIFSILDLLLRCSQITRRNVGLNRANQQVKRPCSIPLCMSEKNLSVVENLLKSIPNNLISQVSFNYGSNVAALFYIEQELKVDRSDEKLQQNLEYLQRIYVSLGDMDSVLGVSAVRKEEPSKCELILENTVQNKMEDSIKDMEHVTRNDPSNLVASYALVQAYLNVEEPEKAESWIRSALSKRPEWEVAFEAVQMESLVKLRKWEELRTTMDKVESVEGNVAMEDKLFTWNIAICRTMSKVENNEWTVALQLVEKLKTKLVAPLIAACEEIHPYKRAYNNIVQLHILAEVEDAIKLLQQHSQYILEGKITATQGKLLQDIKRLINNWETRLWNASNSRKVVDQILNVRKTIFEIMKNKFAGNKNVCKVLNASIRECWLDVAREASKCGNFVRADNCLLQAKQFMSPKVLIEEAKILSRKGKKESAISSLQKAIDQYFPVEMVATWRQRGQTQPTGRSNENTSGHPSESQMLYSKALMLQTTLCEEQKLLNMEDYIAKYKEAVDVYHNSEKNYFVLGSYHDRLLTSAENIDRTYELQATVVRYYCKSLPFGCKYVYQSLPRLLQIWFDFAAGVHGGTFNSSGGGSSPLLINGSSSTGSRCTPSGALLMMQNSIKEMISCVPAYVLMTAFSQLTSRICHSHAGTWSLLKDIIVRIIKTYPYQTLWMTAAVSKSVNSMRAKRCKEIYTGVEKGSPSSLVKMIKDYENLVDKFIGLCDKNVEKNSPPKVSLAKIYDKLPRLIRAMGEVAIPFQVFMFPSLPRKGSNHQDHEPFPEQMVFIENIDDEVVVMSSLVRPKKITIRGSNGKQYGLLVKPQDDLRKDNKVMEVNNLVNWYLNQNAEASQRRLLVRTYSVVPLNERCGLLEWIDNLQPIRAAILTLYREKNLGPVVAKRGMIDVNDSLPAKREKFVRLLLKPSPPVFSDWFFNRFHDHQSWYAARLAYTRTAAVMSMTGYIMGLGDRHGENILLDTKTGEVVHVDLNCIFNKGETFEYPEKVPFRLTHNMVDAMGPLGYEGVFRKTCEIVMSVFRENKTIFLAVLRPFVFDPLVEWTIGSRGRSTSAASIPTTGETTNEKAVDTMKYIRHRINGTGRNMKNDINTELAVEAQVKYLIDEATSLDNLCQMFLGWAAHL